MYFLPTSLSTDVSPGASSPVDDRLRVLRLNARGRRLLVWSYSAHPTLVARNSLEADGDYPARVARGLEEKLDFDQNVSEPFTKPIEAGLYGAA